MLHGAPVVFTSSSVFLLVFYRRVLHKSKIAEIDLSYSRMGTSNVCNCTRNYIIQFTAATWKLSPFLMLLLLPLASARLDIRLTDVLSISCSESESAIKNRSALEENLKVVMSSLIEKVNKTGYNLSWSGQNGDKVYGLA